MEEAKLKISTGIDQLDGKQLHRVVRVVNDILRLALKADADFLNKAYRDFVVETCSGGGVGRACDCQSLRKKFWDVL